MTDLNGLTRPWESFIHIVCARKEIMKFDIVWEDCVQEEYRVATREALLREDDKSIATHTRRRIQSKFNKDSHKEYRPPNKFQRKRENSQKKDYSKYQCYNYRKIGHLARECPLKNKNTKIYHAHLAENEDEEEEEGPRKRRAEEEDVEEYVLFSALSRSIIPGEDTWLFDSGASKHMTGKKQTLSRIEENNYPKKYH